MTSWQRHSYLLGTNLALFGWMGFTLALLFTFLFLPQGMSFLGFVFKVCGLFIVSGWLLLRFSEGLFPFGRRMFKGN